MRLSVAEMIFTRIGSLSNIAWIVLGGLLLGIYTQKWMLCEQTFECFE